MSEEEAEKLKARMSARGLRPCPVCAERRFYVGRVGFEHTTGGSGHTFDLVICGRCGKTDLYVDNDPKKWVEWRADCHTFLEYRLPEPAPYRG